MFVGVVYGEMLGKVEDRKLNSRWRKDEFQKPANEGPEVPWVRAPHFLPERAEASGEGTAKAKSSHNFRTLRRASEFN